MLAYLSKSPVGAEQDDNTGKDGEGPRVERGGGGGGQGGRQSKLPLT